MATKKTATKKAAIKAPVTKTAEPAAATKKVTVKKAAAKKVAPAKKATTKKAAIKKTTIVAKCDVGFGNTLFIRGEGAGLSWEVGTPMENKGTDEWVWATSDTSTDIEAKVIIGDEAWAEGANIIAPAGKKTVIEPSF